MSREKITEHILQEGKITVEGNILKGVKLLGLVSENGRIYTPEAVRAAIPLYEGANCNLNHGWMRMVEDRFARVRNVRYDEGLRGDLHCNPELDFFKPLKWWAENDPGAIGMSHVVDADKEILPNGVEKITQIYAVDAVDLVADPATTKGLGEAMNGKTDAKASEQPGTIQLPPGTNITINGVPLGESTKAKTEAVPPEPAKTPTAEDLRQKELAKKGEIYEEAVKIGLAHTHLQGAFLEQLMLAPTPDKLKEWLKAKQEELKQYGLITPTTKTPTQTAPAGTEPVTLPTQEQFVARLTH